MSAEGGEESCVDVGRSGEVSGVCCIFCRFGARTAAALAMSSQTLSSEIALSGLEGVWHLLRAEAVRSRRARLEALVGWLEILDRGVKKRWNLRGVMEGFRLSLAWLDGILGGEESRLRAMVAVVLAAVDEALRSLSISVIRDLISRPTRASALKIQPPGVQL